MFGITVYTRLLWNLGEILQTAALMLSSGSFWRVPYQVHMLMVT